MKKWDKLLWLGVLVGILADFFYTVAHGEPAANRPRAPRLKPAKVTPYPTQGAGALALLAPKAAIIPPEILGVYYFAATCQDNFGLESDYSNEAIATNYATGFVTLAWDPSPGTNVITNYTTFQGGASRSYTNVWWAGTNLTARMPWQTLFTNIVLTVTCTNGGTNIVIGLTPRGPWTKLNTTNYVTTNLPSPRYFRGLGKAGNRVVIGAKRVL